MKVLKSFILVIAVLITASGLTGCDQKSNTLATVTITPANQIMAKNTNMLFTAYGTFTNGMTLNWTQVVSWSSSDPTIASVDNTSGLNCIVTSSTNTGTVIITAFDVANKITGTAAVTVMDPDPTLTILPIRPYMAVGTAYPFSAIASFTSGSLASGQTGTQSITSFATWTSLSPGVAGVGNGLISTGSVTGVVATHTTGTTIIQGMEPISGATGTTILTVTSTPLASIAIEQINPTIISMTTTTQQQFTAIGTFRDGTTTKTLTPNEDASWNWLSSNIGVATIDLYTGLATAVAPGSTLITARDPISGVIAPPITLTIQQ